ncbi:MAG: DUF4124 domain-containing protein [Gammaproteobacteria bacterium]|nr:DUF4124 domain-containing protein [Gammaproteobacteria bacterium]
MFKTLLLALALLPGLAAAVICKSVDEDGVVSYTDVPAGECTNRVELPDYSRYAPRPIEQAAQQGSNATGNVVRFVRYESIAITQPKTGGTVRSNEGRVTVVIALTPALQPGHRVNLTLDGRPVRGSFDGLAIDLNGVDRGTHTLRASVIDADARVLIASTPVTFTLRKRGLTDSNPDAPPPEPPPTPDPGFPAPTTPPDYSPPPSPGFGPPDDPDFSPPGSPNFTPPANPGFAPNGAFTPNFNR